MNKLVRREWLIPVVLITLSLIPIIDGMVRLFKMAGGVEAENYVRYFESPLPAILHIVGTSVYLILGAFQFIPGFRQRRPEWHRVAGRALIPFGVTAALSGVWLTLFYPPLEYDSLLLNVQRILAGSAWVILLFLGLAAVLRRDFLRHRNWMIRGYAIGFSNSTAIFGLILVQFLPFENGELAKLLGLGGPLLFNIIIAEWLIRRKLGPSIS